MKLALSSSRVAPVLHYLWEQPVPNGEKLKGNIYAECVLHMCVYSKLALIQHHTMYCIILCTYVFTHIQKVHTEMDAVRQEMNEVSSKISFSEETIAVQNHELEALKRKLNQTDNEVHMYSTYGAQLLMGFCILYMGTDWVWWWHWRWGIWILFPSPSLQSKCSSVFRQIMLAPFCD